ncbi:YceD family protein [Thiococcus pfennigii]|jgi:uncharacterized protein|uniref:YceD family protein n=1 Tax=Thiococcus pfennigii TaxID=1057 RepID=UPI00190794F7|nr:YceD family protein [Thiococcus pfennigii]MBK1700447.1 hypothetical protein [Thiococcus pfennigii]MBK1731304.1 hypothetical protein [Thiococcus pfennigii]
MFVALPDRVDFWRAVSGGASFRGELALGELPRLRTLLMEPHGVVRFGFDFGRDPDGRGVARATLEAVLRLQCQRCLEVMDYPVSATLTMAAVASLDEVDRLPEGYDPLLLDDRHVRPRDLIEDELLLALPLIPRHASPDCLDAGLLGDAQIEGEALGGPFAALADWRQPHSH